MKSESSLSSRPLKVLKIIQQSRFELEFQRHLLNANFDQCRRYGALLANLDPLIGRLRLAAAEILFGDRRKAADDLATILQDPYDNASQDLILQ